MLTIVVPGRPRPQGSKRALGPGRMIESSPHVGEWRARVSLFASSAMHPVGKPAMHVSYDPVQLTITFWFLRPKSSKLARPTGRWCGDIDKLARACLDGLTGIAFADDSQVCLLTAEKAWGDEDCCQILMTPLLEEAVA